MRRRSWGVWVESSGRTRRAILRRWRWRDDDPREDCEVWRTPARSRRRLLFHVGWQKNWWSKTQAIQIRRGVRPMAAIGEGDARAAAPEDWPGFEGKLAISAEQANRSMAAPGDVGSLWTYVMTVGLFVGARDMAVASALKEHTPPVTVSRMGWGPVSHLTQACVGPHEPAEHLWYASRSASALPHLP